MANAFKLELNSSGVRELLRSDEMKRICEEEAEKVVSKLGDGYVVSSYTGKSRVNASIMATSWEAYYGNLKNNTVLKALK